MKKKIKEIAFLLDGNVIGDGEAFVEHLRAIDEAGEGDLTFLSNPRYLKSMKTTGASAILVAPGTECAGKNLIVVRDPYVALGKLLNIFYPEEDIHSGISGQAFIDKGAQVSKEATIYPGAAICRGAKIERGVVLYPGVFIGHDALIDEDSVLYPNVCVYRKCLIGKRVILHAGVVVGGDGFGFANPGVDNLKIPQVGIVQIDDDVEIGANSAIDRATLGKTWIKRGVKIDNLVQIAHNVVVGENSVIVSQVGIAGSTKLGKSVIIGGQSGLVGHITIGDNVIIGSKSGVHEDVPSGQTVSGFPHLPHRQWLRVVSCISKLPDMRKILRLLSNKVRKLEEEREIKEKA
ncbi:MAG TPA: UDP-3-O-(3-hydroxymyristoyl)glucosamine N-acyltransferase [Syntrophales bacterium]|nr:UDP-3-O-(3-hydroxymyristoyl)glucosamine N-acyltransferase [Syntrophales bacterium]